MKLTVNLLLAGTLMSSCASFDRLGYKEKIVITAGVGSVVGYSVGTSSYKESENKGAYGTMYGAMGAAIIGLASLYFFDNNSFNGYDQQKIINENKELSIKVQDFEKQLGLELISKGRVDGDNTPEDLRPYFKNGRWERYKLLRWQQDPEDENIFFKITEQLKVIPKNED